MLVLRDGEAFQAGLLSALASIQRYTSQWQGSFDHIDCAGREPCEACGTAYMA
jgi:hypothetical protein